MASLLTHVRARLGASLRDLWSDGRGWILLAVGTGWALTIGVRFVYPALVPFLRAEFSLALTTTGLLLTLLWAAYAVGHVPGGVLADRFGEGTVLAVSALVAALTLAVVATAGTVWTLFAGTVAFGLATALYGPTRITIFTTVYPTRAGSAIGVTMAAGSVGNTVLPVAAVVVATYSSWRVGFGAFVPLFAAVAVALWLVVPRRTSGPSSVVDELSGRTLVRLAGGLTRGSIPVVVAVQVTISFVLQGFASFYPTYLTTTKGLSPGVAATLFGLFFAVGAVVQPVSGGAMDRFGTRWTLLGSLGGGVLALWLLPFASGLGGLVAVTALLGSINGCTVVTQTHVTDALPAEMRGTGFGTLKAGWMLLGATAPLVVGALADVGHFDAAFLLLAAAGTVGVAVTAVRL